jgi:superfamily I DNA/RNA helicase
MSNYTDEQLAFINFNGSESLIFSAVAGSGKTHSAVGRLNKMLADGVDPKRMIFFSFTNDAVDELRSRVGNDSVRITTIHAYTLAQLAKMGKFKPVATFFEFAAWYKEKKKPKPYDSPKKKMKFQEIIDSFYEDGAYISSTFSAFKLQSADGIKAPIPDYYQDYRDFLRETKSRDFADMLIECEKLAQNPQYKHFFEGTYDYVFVDEYQDTSTLQLKTLLYIKAKQYFLIGDKNQSIYGFSGANCDAIEELLKKERTVLEFNLTKNFRSAKKIVEHANKFSQLKAVPHSTEDGLVNHHLITEDDLWDMMVDGKPLTVLVRTNKVIKEIEKKCLREKVKMRYFNFLTRQDLEHIKAGKINPAIKRKLDQVASYHGCPVGKYDKLINFIEENQNSNVFVTSIHKSKGREYPRVVVINSFDPEQLMDVPELIEDYSFLSLEGEIDVDAMNLHYVACTRPKEEIYFLMYEL